MVEISRLNPYIGVMALPGFQVLTLTDAAAQRVRDILANAEGGAEGIRVGIKKGGCAGMEYTVDLVHEPAASDDMVEIDGAKVFVDPSATLFLLGTEMDFEVTKFRTGFVFRNPNQTSACGCGESVELAAADPEKFRSAHSAGA